MFKSVFLKSGFLLTFCITYVQLFAQQTDWKKEVTQKSSKIEQAEYLFTYARKNEYKESCFNPLETALEISKETGVDSLVGKSYFDIGKCHLGIGDLNQASFYFKKAKFIFLKNRMYNAIVSLLYWESKIFLRTQHPDSLIATLDRNRPFINLATNEREKQGVMFMYANALMMLNEKEKALNTYYSLLPGMEARKDTAFLLSACLNIAQLQTSFDSAMIWYRKMLPLAKQADPGKYAELLTQIGRQYIQRDDAKKDSALYYYLEAGKYVSYMKDAITKVIYYTQTADYFYQKGENKLALPYFSKAYEYGKQTGIEQPVLIHNMALIYLVLRQFDSTDYYREEFKRAAARSNDDYVQLLLYQFNTMYANAKGDSCSIDILNNYERAIYYSAKLGNTRHGADILDLQAMKCLLHNPQVNSHVKAIAGKILVHCDQLYALVKSEGKLVNFSSFLERYAALEELYGDKGKALKLYKELVKIQNEIRDKKYTEGIDEALVKYKSDLKDAEIQLLTEKEHINNVNIELFIVGMLALLSILILIFVLYRREKKNKKELDIRNKKMEELLREIHHRVKNNLQIVSSFINIQLDKVSDKEAVQALTDTSRRIMALASLHHSLYRQDDFSRIQLDEYIEDLCNNLSNTMQHSQRVKLYYNLERLLLNIDQAIPIGLALNELITNALKYAFDAGHPSPEIVISLQKRGDTWELMVKDNGKGLPENFQEDQHKSIGLRLVQNLIQRQVKGLFTHRNENGASFYILFSKVL